jgi:Flp pilus assembly protein TadG
LSQPRNRPGRIGRRTVRVDSSSTRGQTLVEFALVFPIFLTLLLGLIEFAFAFHAALSLGYASRDAALLAAESGNAPGGDCLILQKIEQDITAPADSARISTVDIYWSDRNGNAKAGAVNLYTRGGSLSCNAADGSTYTLPYTATSLGYAESTRCPILSGCGGAHSGIDTIGVKITYSYSWHTPLSSILKWGGSTTLQIDRANAMRMEPIL